MKLITWNIQFGVGVDGKLDLARIIAHAKSMADFDVLCLQEVADNFPDIQQGALTNQFAEIAALLPGYEAIEGPGVDVPDGKGDRRRFGNMMLSRYPVGRIFRHAMPWVTDGSRSMPRLLIDAVIHAPWGPLRVMTTHLEYYSPAQRAGQVDTIRRAIQEGRVRASLPPVQGPGGFAPTDETPSAILTADFNMTVDNPTFRRLLERDNDGAPGLIDAWQTLHPGEAHPFSFCIYDQRYDQPHCCDFILLTPDLRPRLRRVFYDTQTQVSDHQPVLVELDD
jgi:endonuclease/exonuclease/phosphatase family metal-dependent hydrolase